MKKNKTTIIILELLLLVFILIYELILYNKFNSVQCNNILIGFWILFSSIMIIRFKIPKDRNYLKSNTIRLVVITLLSLILLMFSLGLFTGFYKTPYSLVPLDILKNIIPIVLVIISQEIIRHIIAKNSQDSKVPITFLTILYITYNILLYSNGYNFYNVELIFRFICSIAIPFIARESLYSYITYKVSYIPTLILTLLLGIYHYVLPIYPDLNDYLYSIIGLIWPCVVYIAVNKTIKYAEKSNTYVKSVSKTILFIPITIFTIIMVVLVSGIFKYKMIAIASDSMNPIYKRGDAVIYEKIDYKDVKIGDILVFKNDNMVVTHRVIKKYEKDNVIGFKTKGDNNKVEDGYVVESNNVLGIVKYKVANIGYPTVWLNEAF